jgi:methylglutaconyl-CoA hydratase
MSDGTGETAGHRVRYEVGEGVATVTLDRADKRNALDAAMVDALRHAFERAGVDRDVRVVLLRAEGPDFCAGADLAALERIAAGAGPIDNLEDAARLGDLFVRMRRIEKPIVAAVHGNAIAGGAGLATACDIIVAAEDATFGYPEVHLGFVPAMVMALLRRAAGEKVAFALLARGNSIDAAEAARIGLVARVAPSATLQQDAAKYAAELAARSGSALALIKRLFYGIDGMSFEDAIARGAEVNALARATDDCQAGVRRFLERQRR